MLALRLAWRDLRGGLGGLKLLAACLVIGVAALAGVGSLSAAILDGLSSGGRAIMGGDVEMKVAQRRADPSERAAFAAAGTVSESIRMRAMASRVDGRDAVLVDLKGVDGRYPLYGDFRLAAGALKPRPGPGEVAIAPALAGRLAVKPGDTLSIGGTPLRIVGLVASEPDRAGEGFALGPVVLMDLATLEATGLAVPGSLFDARYRIRLADPAADARAVTESLSGRFRLGGWEARDRRNAAPSLRRFIARLGQFLSLLGLAALAVAGIGVGNGVTSWAEGKRGGIATLKALGADSGTIFRLYLVQVVAVAVAGIAAGLAIGAAVPWIVGRVAGDALPVAPGAGPYPAALLLAAGYGLLVALLFSLAPLAGARRVTAAALFRGTLGVGGGIGWRVRLAQGGLAAALAALAILSSEDRATAAGFVAAVLVLLALLAVVGRGLAAGAAALPRPRRPLLRLALASLHRPGAATVRLVVALGLGLTLFAAMATVQTSLAAAMRGAIPARAPSFFMLDIPQDDVARLRATVAGVAPGAELTAVPMMRGAVTGIAGRRVADMKTIPERAWILRGDRGLTYAATLPPSNTVVAGQWWPADYAGPPLVSIDVDAAEALGLKIGDAMTVSVLGVEIAARIASFRRIDWQTMGFNFAILFAPGALEAAPHSFAATIAVPQAAEAGLSRALAAAFPESALIRVKDVIGQVAGVLGQMGLAIAAAGSVAVLAGVAVLIGAVAASRRARTYDAVLLKLLGATRGQVLAAQAIEFAVLGLAVAALALAVGAGGGWYLVVRVFGLPFDPDWAVVAGTVVAGAVATVAIALAATLPTLNARPAAALRGM